MSQLYRGPCSYCNALNPYSDFDCRECGQRLPWADALTQKLFEGQDVALGMMQQAPGTIPGAPSVPLHAQPGYPSPSVSPPPAYQNLQSPDIAPQSVCPSCGAAHSSHANYCPSCGLRIWEGMANLPLPQPRYYGPHQLANVPKKEDDFARNFMIVILALFMGWVFLHSSFALTPLLLLALCFMALRRLLRNPPIL